MSEPDIIEIEEDQPSHCFACESVLRNPTILICASCLDDAAEDFFFLFEGEDRSDIEED